MVHARVRCCHYRPKHDDCAKDRGKDEACGFHLHSSNKEYEGHNRRLREKKPPLCLAIMRRDRGLDSLLRFPLSGPERELGTHRPGSPFPNRKGGQGDRTAAFTEDFSVPLPHSFWGRGQGLGLCSSVYLRDRTLGLPFGSFDDHLPRRNRVRFNIDDVPRSVFLRESGQPC